MRILERDFKPAWWATSLTAAGVALMIALGFWQLGRAQYKAAIQSQIDDYARQAPLQISAGTIEVDQWLLRRVQVLGEFDARYAVFIDNRVHKQQPGYHVMMPLRIAGSDKYVLVNRGWVSAGAQRNQLPAVKTPMGEVMVIGTAVPYSERFLELSSKIAEGKLWQNMVLERYRQATRLDVQPIIVQQTGFGASFDDGLVRDWPPVDLKRNTHLAYAVQWFATAVAILIVYVVVNVRRKSRDLP